MNTTNNKPYILEIVRNLEKGGRTKRLLQTAHGLRQRGFRVQVATFFPPPQWVKELWPESKEWLCLNKKEGLDPGLIFRFAKLLKQERFSLVHAHCEESYLYGGSAAQLASVPTVGTYHRSDLNYFRKNWKNSLWNRLIKQKVSISSDRMQRMVSGLGIPLESIELIHGGVDPQKIQPVWDDLQIGKTRDSLNVPGTAKVILGIGHLAPIKGHDITIKSLPDIIDKIPEAVCYLAGDGTPAEWDRLRSLIQSLQLTDRVTLLGQQSNVGDWLAVSDVLVQPSIEEGFGLVFTEAGAAGRPVVATKVGGIQDIVIEGETGFLVEPDRPDAVADRTIQILSNKELRKNMGRSARTHIESNFNLDLMADRYADLFKKMIA